MVPEELQYKMRKHSEIRWSEVIRKAIEKKINDLEMLEELTSKSMLTKEDVLEISRKIDSSVSRKLGFL